MPGDRCVVPEFGEDAVRQLFPELHSPLVEAVDVPDDALYEDPVLVGGDEPAQAEGRQSFKKDGVCRAHA